MNETNKWQWIWAGSLTCFLVAASTGALYRFGMLYRLPSGLALSNVRHAHSHLMFLGWVTPLLMGLIVLWCPRVTGQSLPYQRGFGVVIGVVLLLAGLAYVPFLLYGYQAADIWGHRLPLSSMVVGLAMFSWYGFIWLYWRATRGHPRPMPVRLWDAALAFLILASIGAWGVAVIARLGLENPFWSVASTQLFTDTFADGWFTLAVLGVLYACFPAAKHNALLPPALRQNATNLLILGLPLVFLLNLPVGFVPEQVRWLASLAGLLVVCGLAVHIVTLWSAVTVLYRWPLFFLGLKGVVLLLLTIPAGAEWIAQANLRISYLHWLLLGFVTLSLILVAQSSWRTAVNETFLRPFLIAVTMLFITLIPLTRLWPVTWSGRWVLYAAAWGTIPPILILVLWWVASWRALTQPKHTARVAKELR